MTTDEATARTRMGAPLVSGSPSALGHEAGLARRSPWVGGGIALLGVGLLAWNLWTNRFFFHDDAFISLRYARNLVDLGDLSWNPGDRVEGYTNFLHVIATSALMWLGLDGVGAARTINALGGAGLVSAVAWGARTAIPGGATTVAGAVAVAAALGATPVAIWILGGLESVLAAAFLTGGVAALLPCFSGRRPGSWIHPLVAGILFALAYLTRPDSVVMCAAAGLAVLAMGSAPLARRAGQCVLTGAIPLAVIGIHLAWRLSYYGDVVPNTARAKLGGALSDRVSDGSLYVLESSVRHLPAPVLGLAAFALLLALGRGSRVMAYLAACILAHSAYVVWSGGDHMPGARVLLGVLGPGCILLGVALSAFPPRWGGVLSGGALAVLTAAAFVTDGQKMNPAAYIGLVVGRHVDAAWPQGSVVALNTAGSTPWAAPDHVYVDMLGLNDRAIALREDVPIRTERQEMAGHGKGDGAYVLSRRPDYIILGPAEGRAADDPWFLSDLEIAEAEEFARCYEVRRTELPYSVPPAARIGFIANPLPLTYYERTCPR